MLFPYNILFYIKNIPDDLEEYFLFMKRKEAFFFKKLFAGWLRAKIPDRPLRVAFHTCLKYI